MPAHHQTPILRSAKFLGHDTGDHVEHPLRIRAINQALEATGMLVDRPEPTFRPAEIAEVERVHTPEYIAALYEFGERGGGWIDNDTYCGTDSFEIALLAAGAAIAAVDIALDGPHPHAFALGRPPGHHATAGRGMGFCLINNVAVAAAHALSRGVQRVAIVDWDVHHGNGTQDIFYDRDDVLFCSVHQYGLFYPGTGHARERGHGHGTGHTINVPLSAGQGDRSYLHVMDEIFHMPIHEFHPELILISAGFDAHEHDPLGGMAVTDRGFARMAQRVVRWAEEAGHDRVAAVLEGGYDPGALGRSVVSVLNVLDGGAIDRYDEQHPAGSDQ
ncbi:MAG: histone deacetylase [Thermomicrobiales bacterium]|nr:histone deacetylase [Thermomicrobiales bacterium]